MGKEFQHAGGNRKALVLLAVEFGLLLQDAQAKFVIGRVQIDDKAALQARFDAVFQILDLARRAVGGNHDLFVLINQGVEGVEEFFLRRILAGDELHIIHHQHVDRAEQFLEIHDLLVAQGLHEAIHELLGGQIQHAQMRLARLKFMRNRVHQVGFAQTDAAVKEQRVEGDRATFGHTAGGGMGQVRSACRRQSCRR